MGNANSAVVWGVVLIVLAAAGLVAGAIVFFTRFNRETRRLTEKMCHAGEDGEYRYLAGKLRRHYLLLIPFVTRRNVGRVDRFFTCHQKNAKEKSARAQRWSYSYAGALRVGCLSLRHLPLRRQFRVVHRVRKRRRRVGHPDAGSL